MKKILLFSALAAIFSLVSCNNEDYKAKGKAMSGQLEQLCENKDTAAVLMLNDSIRAIEAELEAAGDSTGLSDFRNSIADARAKCGPFITVSKMEQGVSKDDAVQDIIDDVLNGAGGDVTTVTKSIAAALEKEKASGKVVVIQEPIKRSRRNGAK